MPLYEIILIARQEISTTEVDKLIEDITGIIGENNGEVIKQEYWGLRSFAYPINNSKKGHYVFLGISADYEAIEKAEHYMRYSQDIIRNSIIKADSKDSIEKGEKDDFVYANPWYKSAPFSVKASIKRQETDEKLALELESDVDSDNEEDGEYYE